jgi:tetratricopeptide (TPR) repeat protein/DNA-binding CsgD family transcriptional regulator
MPKTLATPKMTLEEVEFELRKAKHVRKKFELIIELCKFMRRDLPRMLSLAESLVELTERHPDLGILRHARAEWWVAYSYRLLYKYEKSLEHFLKSQSILNQSAETVPTKEKDLLSVEICDNIAIIHYYLGNYEKAMEYFTIALGLSEKYTISGGIIAQHNNIGEIWRLAGNYEKAYLHWSMALNISYSMKDLRRIAELLNNLASVHEYYGEYDQAFELIERSIAHAVEYNNDFGQSGALINKARLLIEKNRLDEAEQCCKQAIDLSNQHSLKKILLDAKEMLATVLIKRTKYDSALEILAEIQTFEEALLDPALMFTTTYLIAECYGVKNNLKKSLKHAQKALELANKTESIQHKIDSLNLLSKLECLLQNFEKANFYSQECLQAMREANRLQHTQEIREAKLRLMMETAEREREELQKKAQELERALDEKRGELASMALAVSQKNALIERLNQKLSELASQDDLSYSVRCQTMMHEIELLKQTGENQWEHLQKQFESMDAGYEQRLLERYPTLSTVELKICLLMRLNLTTKDIASILWASPRTVETHRYSIRKKMSLGKDENLHHVMSKL